MTFLIVDSATERAACALFVDDKMVAQKDIEVGFLNTRLLMPAIFELCMTANIATSKLQFVASGVGPGSFTGIRVSCALAKGIAAGLSIPVVGISSLHGFVPLKEMQGLFMSAIDARIGGVFCIEGEMKDGVRRYHTQEQLISVAEFEIAIRRNEMLVTPHAASLKKRVDISSLFVVERSPDLAVMGQEALQRFQTNDFGPLIPLYLRATQAELELK